MNNFPKTNLNSNQYGGELNEDLNIVKLNNKMQKRVSSLKLLIIRDPIMIQT